MFSLLLKWLEGSNGGLTPDPQAATRRWALTSLAVGLLLGAAITFSCKPSFKKEVLKTKESLDKETILNQALNQENVSLKTTLSATQSRRKTRTTEHIALDGHGNAIIGPSGSPVILRDTTVLASDNSSTATSEDIKTISSLKTTLSEKDKRISSLEKSLEERRGGTMLFGSFGTDKRAGLDLNAKAGALGYGVGGNMDTTNPKDWAITGRLGLDLGLFGL